MINLENIIDKLNLRGFFWVEFDPFDPFEPPQGHFFGVEEAL